MKIITHQKLNYNQNQRRRALRRLIQLTRKTMKRFQQHVDRSLLRYMKSFGFAIEVD